MKLKDQNILFLTRTMALGGTENVILQLCEIFKPLVNKIIVCSCGGVNESKLNSMGIKHVKIKDIENKNPTNIIHNIKVLKRIIKEENITIIHSHHRMAAMYANLVANKKIKKIANAHNTFKDKKNLTRIAYKNTKIVAVGEMVKKNLIDFFGLDSSQITVIHNAVKPFSEKVTIDQTLLKLKNDGYFLIGNIGRLSKQKGMEYYIEAAKIVKTKTNKKIKYIIVGDGEDSEKLKEKVKDDNLVEDIIFMGYRKDIQNVMSQLDLIVLSSLWEGLPLTPIEAFSVGKTIVATSVDGTVEIVKNNKNGLLVESKDAKGIANGIINIVNDNKKKNKFELEALKTYYDEFSFNILSNNYINYYKNEVCK